MSSSVLGHAITPTNQFDLAQKQARLVNCTDDTPANIINCLKTKTAQEIAATVPGFRVNIFGFKCFLAILSCNICTIQRYWYYTKSLRCNITRND